LDANGKILLMNRTAESILAKNDGLRVDRGALSALRSTDMGMMRRMIQDAIRTKDGGAPPGGALSLPRPSLKRALNLLITPACENPSLFPYRGAAAAVFVSDPETVTESDAEVLSRLYGL